MLELVVEGYKKTVCAYIIPKLSHELILGKPWMEREDVIYFAKEQYMEIREAEVVKDIITGPTDTVFMFY